jgi:hypothetical protein
MDRGIRRYRNERAAKKKICNYRDFVGHDCFSRHIDTEYVIKVISHFGRRGSRQDREEFGKKYPRKKFLNRWFEDGDNGVLA